VGRALARIHLSRQEKVLQVKEKEGSGETAIAGTYF
jgi:hypothetical protein